MLISLNWLKEYVGIDVPVEKLAEILTMAGLEIEAINRRGEGITNVVIGKILSIQPHPDAEKLVVCKTDVGQSEPLQIVCGAKNMKVGDIVPTALVGATLPGGFSIGSRKMRGVDSSGMMCSARELGISDDQSGLLILDPSLTVGADALRVLGLDDVIVEVEITPNRGDWASMIGVARELAAIMKKPCSRYQVYITESENRASDISSVSIEDPDLCPRYIGRVLENVKIGPSPAWMQQKLIAAGQRPINNVVDITNFVLLETGHPLHAFDLDKLTEKRIVVRRAKQGETIRTIDEQVQNLSSDMLIIADAKNPVAVAGVMGGFDSEVGETTTRVFLESAYFNPVSVRRTARALGMQTEASARFQRGADPEMAAYAIDRAAALMQELAGATVAKGMLDVYPQPLPVKEITLRYARTDLLLGTSVPPEFQRDALQWLRFEMKTFDEKAATFKVPSWRHDCAQEADLIEEVARVYGYENIKLTIPSVHPSQEVFSPEEKTINDLRASLIDQGLVEFMPWTFFAMQDIEKCGLSSVYPNPITLQNPLSETTAVMRPTLIPCLLGIAANNMRHGTTDIAGFEIGPVYAPTTKEPLPLQRTRVGVVLSGAAQPTHWSGRPRPFDFFDLKGWLELLMESLGAAFSLEEADLPTFEPGHRAQIRSNGTPIGSLGRVASKVLRALDIAQPVYVLEVELDTLLRTGKPSPQFQELPTFPPSLRDMAVLVDVDVPAESIRVAAEKAGGKLLKKAGLFDIYKGDQVPAGKKSIALSLMFQSDERTLTDADTQKAWDKILKRLEFEFKAQLR